MAYVGTQQAGQASLTSATQQALFEAIQHVEKRKQGDSHVISPTERSGLPHGIEGSHDLKSPLVKMYVAHGGASSVLDMLLALPDTVPNPLYRVPGRTVLHVLEHLVAPESSDDVPVPRHVYRDPSIPAMSAEFDIERFIAMPGRERIRWELKNDVWRDTYAETVLVGALLSQSYEVVEQFYAAANAAHGLGINCASRDKRKDIANALTGKNDSLKAHLNGELCGSRDAQRFTKLRNGKAHGAQAYVLERHVERLDSQSPKTDGRIDVRYMFQDKPRVDELKQFSADIYCWMSQAVIDGLYTF